MNQTTPTNTGNDNQIEALEHQLKGLLFAMANTTNWSSQMRYAGKAAQIVRLMVKMATTPPVEPV